MRQNQPFLSKLPSPSPLVIVTHQSIMLVDNAAENPRMLKLISVAVHNASPPMTGIRDRLTNSPGKNKTGMCVKWGCAQAMTHTWRITCVENSLLPPLGPKD